MIVRQLSSDDFAALSTFTCAGRRQDEINRRPYEMDVQNWLRTGAERWLSHSSDRELWIADDDGQIVGFCALEMGENSDQGLAKYLWFVKAFGVSVPQHNKKVGTRLFQTVLNQLRGRIPAGSGVSGAAYWYVHRNNRNFHKISKTVGAQWIRGRGPQLDTYVVKFIPDKLD